LGSGGVVRALVETSASGEIGEGVLGRTLLLDRFCNLGGDLFELAGDFV